MNTRLTFSILIMTVTFLSAQAEPNGAVLYRGATRYGHYNVPGDAGHHYFNFLEGPAWENKYTAFRMYIDMDDRNAIDIMGKYHQEAILQHFSDPNLDPHNNPSWGADILSVGSAMGLGSFRLFNNGQWINPQLPETLDSLVVTITDSSLQTPQVEIGYHGWNIGSGTTVTVLWTLSTSLDDRATHCELEIIGNYTGKVVAGMVNHRENTNNPNRNTVTIIQEEDPPLLATLGKQSSITEGFDDTLLMAMFADPAYFDSFEKQGSTNLGMVLTPDDDNKVRWSFAFSWAREEDPLFRHEDWRDSLIPTTGVNREITGAPVPVNSAKGAIVNATSLVYMLNGRVYGKQSGSTMPSQRCSNGVYVMQRNGAENGNGNLTRYKVTSLTAR